MTYKEFRQQYKFNEATDRIGGGGFGVVYKALDTHVTIGERQVAVKAPKPGHEHDENIGIMKEAQIVLLQPDSPYIARYFEFYDFEAEGHGEMAVMQYYKNGNLRNLLNLNLSHADKETILEQILDGIDFLHSLKPNFIIHKDLKPENILIDEQKGKFIPKISDFGISKLAEKHYSDYVATNDGFFNKLYAAPEQFKSPIISRNVDLYSFGIIAVEVFTGEHLYNNPEVINNKNIPENWRRLINKCIVFDPKDRVQNVAECKEILAQPTDLVEIKDDDKSVENSPKKTIPPKVPPTPLTGRINKKRKWKGLWWLLSAIVFAVVLYLFHSELTSIFNKEQIVDKPVVAIKRNGEVYNPDGIELVYVEGSGTTKDFYIGKYEVTQAQWKTIMGGNPSYFQEGDSLGLPVENVSWNDAQEFLSRLNAKTGKNYRLPTEVEWEFAAKGGRQNHNYTYSGSNNLDIVAWHGNNSGKSTHMVGTKVPNELDIYDMSGNVWEWCQDWYDDLQRQHVNRGGGWNSSASYCTVAFRSRDTSGFRFKDLGFRVILSSEEANGITNKRKNQEILDTINRLDKQGTVNENTPTLLLTKIETESYRKNPTQQHLTEPEMVFVRGGMFGMGCSDEPQEDIDPLHQVKVIDFYIGKYEVTQAQWKAVMGTNPSNQKGDNLPVEQVSWNDVQNFIRRLNAQTDKQYRLPTEAEWEYSARGGNRSKNTKYSGSNNVEDVAWYYNNSGRTNHPVGTKMANELGIFDMSGNVAEWCSDWYGDYNSSSQTNPIGALTGSFRVFRGGESCISASFCSLWNRAGAYPYAHSPGVGFRLASDSR